MFDEFGSGWRQLTPYGRRGRRDRLLLRSATGQKQAKHQPSFPHSPLFALSGPACRWQSWLHPHANFNSNGGPQVHVTRTESMSAMAMLRQLTRPQAKARFFLRLTASLASVAVIPTLRLQVRFSFTDCSYALTHSSRLNCFASGCV